MKLCRFCIIIRWLEVIIEEKCEAFFIKHTLPKLEDQSVEKEIRLLRNSLMAVENEISLLHEKSDHAIGSLTYISNEYDDFIINSAKLVEGNQTLNSSISRLNKNFDQINKQLTTTEIDLERLEQNGRSGVIDKGHSPPWQLLGGPLAEKPPPRLK